MYNENRKIDVNAYVKDFCYEIKSEGSNKNICVSFTNLYYGTISAIKLILSAKDSFGDKIMLSDNEYFEIKRIGLDIKCGKKCSFTTALGNYDVKQIELVIDQIVFDDGSIVKPLEENIIEYEIERLSTIWTPQEHYEKDAIEVMKKYNTSSICFPKNISSGWICSCGYLNFDKADICAACGKKKEYIMEQAISELVFLSDPSIAPLTKAGEVNDKITSLIGLNQSQFFQTTLIAQGAFSKIITATIPRIMMPELKLLSATI